MEYVSPDKIKIAIKAVKGYKFIIAAKNINNIISNALMLNQQFAYLNSNLSNEICYNINGVLKDKE